MVQTLFRNIVSTFFGSRKAVLASSLFGIAILGLLYVAWHQARGEVQIEMPTGLATGMKTRKGLPATIDAIAMHGSVPDSRPCRHDGRAGERARGINGAAH